MKTKHNHTLVIETADNTSLQGLKFLVREALEASSAKNPDHKVVVRNITGFAK